MAAPDALPKLGEVDDGLVDRFRTVVAGQLDAPGGRGECGIAELSSFAREGAAQCSDPIEASGKLGVLEVVHAFAERDHERIDSLVERRVISQE